MKINPNVKADLHMHTTVSDGTDRPEAIIRKVKEANISFFSITDHDDTEGCRQARAVMDPDLIFINGIELSSRDDKGKYHILGFDYNLDARPLQDVIKKAYGYRMQKVYGRLEFIKNEFGFVFSDEDLNELLKQHNPGKPHIANLMIKYGYADNKKQAFHDYLNKKKFDEEYLHPQIAIQAILDSGGIPVLAHPTYGSGDELILGEDMEQRLEYLMDFGLQGLEAYYSGFTTKIQNQLLDFAQKYDLYVTAGSDYHGSNKMIALGENNLDSLSQGVEGMQRFVRDLKFRTY